MSDYLGLGDRLSAAPSGEMASAAFGDELRAAPYLWSGMSHADIAHAIALRVCGVLDAPTSRALLDSLIEIDRIDLDDVELDPFVGDVYNNRDRLLKRLAPDVAGHLHAGRARREASTIGWLLCCRSAVLNLGDDLADLAEQLARTAAEHAATVMPDFTYLHRAHPTSLGHYLLSHAWPIARHLDRVSSTIDTINRSSPAGSGSVNGTKIPLDRDLLANLLGFDGVMWHTRDSMWAPDLVLEVSGLALQVMTSIDRLAEELQLWTTEAFGFVALADEHCRTSVIMPHKKNPYALTHLRGAARRLSGVAVGVTASMNTASGQPDNRTIAYHDVPSMLRTAAESVRLMRSIVAMAEFDETALADAASDPFMASTEVCDMLTLDHRLDNRSAHRIVGRAIRAALDAGRATITASEINAVAAELEIELEPAVDDQELADTMRATSIVASRRTFGGAGLDSVQKMCASILAQSESSRSTLADHPGRTYAADLLAAASGDEHALTRSTP